LLEESMEAPEIDADIDLAKSKSDIAKTGTQIQLSRSPGPAKPRAMEGGSPEGVGGKSSSDEDRSGKTGSELRQLQRELPMKLHGLVSGRDMI